MVELSTPVKSWNFQGNSRLQSKGCRFNSCPFHIIFGDWGRSRDWWYLVDSLLVMKIIGIHTQESPSNIHQNRLNNPSYKRVIKSHHASEQYTIQGHTHRFSLFETVDQETVPGETSQWTWLPKAHSQCHPAVIWDRYGSSPQEWTHHAQQASFHEDHQLSQGRRLQSLRFDTGQWASNA